MGKRVYLKPKVGINILKTEKFITASGVTLTGEQVTDALEDCLAIAANQVVSNDWVKNLIDQGNNSCFYYCEDQIDACKISSIKALGAGASSSNKIVIKVTYTTRNGVDYFTFTKVTGCTPDGNGYPPNCVANTSNNNN